MSTETNMSQQKIEFIRSFIETFGTKFFTGGVICGFTHSNMCCRCQIRAKCEKLAFADHYLTASDMACITEMYPELFV